jgi:hypothetical protein
MGWIAVAAAAGLSGCGPVAARETPLGASLRFARRYTPAGPPPATEPLGHAIHRITATFRRPCDDASQLALDSAGPESRSAVNCAHLQKLAVLRVAGSEGYDKQAAVVDFEGRRDATAVLIRDADGLYHLVLVSGLPRNVRVAGTQADQAQASAAVTKTVDALRRRDCGAFADVIFRGFGVGKSAADATICHTLAHSPLPAALAAFPEIKPQVFGGDRGYEFFGLDTPHRYYTVLLAAQPTTGYGFVKAYLTHTSAAGP